MERHYTVGYRPEDEIIVTVGVSEAIDLALRALLNPGDEVLYHQPCYVSYHPSVTLAHGVALPVATSARGRLRPQRRGPAPAPGGRAARC